MAKQIKNWKIKKSFLKKEGGVPEILLAALGGDLNNFGNVNQAVGAVCNAGCEGQMQTLFEAYATYGIWLAKNNAVDINFKVKTGETKSPSYC